MKALGPFERIVSCCGLSLPIAIVNVPWCFIYHENIQSALQQQGYDLPASLADTKELRSKVQEAFRSAVWSAKVTLREKDYQQILELECRHLTAFLPYQTECPGSQALFADRDLGLFSIRFRGLGLRVAGFIPRAYGMRVSGLETPLTEGL